MSQRLLPIDAIPTDLWQKPSDLLRLPAQLSTAYRAKIEALGLIDVATCYGDEDGPAGGMTDEDTKKHFARRFSASCGRVQLAVLDPKDDLSSASDLIINSFAGGKVALLDAPCGAGAAFASVLATIASLRRASCIPSDPLEVNIVGGDLSPYALGLSRDLHDALQDSLAEVAISSTFTAVDWNARDKQKTVELLRAWVHACTGVRTRFAVTANFSDFLGNGGNFKECRLHLEDIFRWADTPGARFAWFEPQTKSAMSMFERLSNLVVDMKLHILKYFTNSGPSGTPALSQALLEHPLDVNRNFTVRLSVLMLRDNGEIL
jgi:hypothetical protein